MGKSISGAKKRLRGGEELQDSDEDTLNVWNSTSPGFEALEQPNLPQFRDMLRKIILLFKIARKLGKSDALNIISNIYKPPIFIKLFFLVF